MPAKKLKVTLDYETGADALAMLDKVGRYVDIIEVGGRLIAHEGLEAVEKIQRIWPDKEVVLGGVRLETLGAVLNSPAGMTISAEGLCDSVDPAATARIMRKALDTYNMSLRAA